LEYDLKLKEIAEKEIIKEEERKRIIKEKDDLS